jgi:hypothetical protein
LFAARRSEALSRAQGADKDVQTLSLQISRDVRTAWYNAMKKPSGRVSGGHERAS